MKKGVTRMIITGAICDKCQKQGILKDAYSKTEITAKLRKLGWRVGKRTI